MNTFDLKKYLAEGKLYEAAMACPLPTQDLELNTRNRDSAIKADYIKYGPLNVDEPGDFWDELAEHWDTTVEAAKQSLCGNCAAFDISPSNIEQAQALVSGTPEATRIQFICGDYLACSVPPAALIISDSCFHLISCEDTELYTKLKHGLTPNGSVIFTVPYACFYNSCIYLLRRGFKAMRSEALEGVVLRCARLVYGDRHDDAFLRQRLPYLHLLPTRIDNGHFRQALGVHKLKVVHVRNETRILGKPAQRCLVVQHRHA